MNNIILLATYWNEIEWIHPSLEQIDKIDPIEIIICDGCFDSRYPSYSTDGTREVIEQFVKERDSARLISPVRPSALQGVLSSIKGHSKSKALGRIKLSRLRTVVRSAKLVPYRRNQALTFNYMISISKFWKPGRWFMTHDCDQFYSDSMIKLFSITNENTDYGLLTGKELTFFEGFSWYVDTYEKRNYNNMPHRIFSNTSVKPTRGLIFETIVFNRLYIECVESFDTGYYVHYKFITSQRGKLAYRLGDRKRPDITLYEKKRFTGSHPSIIGKYFHGRIEKA